MGGDATVEGTWKGGRAMRGGASPGTEKEAGKLVGSVSSFSFGKMVGSCYASKLLQLQGVNETPVGLR